MANRKRDIPLQFFVTAEEKKTIRQRMLLSKTRNMSVFLRKMAMDGMIVNVDTSWQKQQFQEIHKIGININQIAKHTNTIGAISPGELEEVKGLLKEIWHILKSSPLNQQ